MSARLDRTDEQIRGIVAQLDEQPDRLDRDDELRKQLEVVAGACRATRPRAKSFGFARRLLAIMTVLLIGLSKRTEAGG
jgi:hypothetical protein